MYDPSGGSYSTTEFPDKAAVCRFVGFTRHADGSIVVDNKVDGAYVQEGEQWYRRGQTAEAGRTLVSEGDVEMSDYVYARCEIVSPLEMAGQELPLRIKLRGIYCWQDAETKRWRFKFSGARIGSVPKEFRETGLFQNAREMGFKVAACDKSSPLYEESEYGPAYISEELHILQDLAASPLTPVQVLEFVIEPKLLQAAGYGHLFNVRTSPVSWVVWDSVQALSADDAARFLRQADSAEVEAEELRRCIRELAGQQENPTAFAQRVAGLAQAMQPGVDRSNVLATSELATLRHIWSQVKPVEEGQAQEVVL